MTVQIQSQPFGRLPDGREVQAFTLSSPAGVSVRVLSLGGIVQSLLTPDREGRLADVVLGFDDLAGYLADRAYMGALIGRVAGRIAGGRLKVGARVFQLGRNDGANTLHGGPAGFDRALWRVESTGLDGGAAVLRLVHHSPDGDQGFPGALGVEATWRLEPSGRLSLDLQARCDAPTRVNLTSHPYWNLSGAGGDIGDHRLRIAADEAFLMGEDLVPARTPSSVAGTALDLRAPRRLAEVIAADDPAVRAVGGLDHVFVLADREPAARLDHPPSGRSLTIETDAEAFVAYGGGGLSGGPPGKAGRLYGAGAGVALEPQARPDRPAVLQPGQVFRWRQALTFGTDAASS
ncbi:MAG: aldose epimerase family protein [Phenylobacterium sp.]|uniref:aldose epimerase family protein n=1 Tax=Phenylobacterium sp. TaxID=1871053 RepID=UPI0039192B99